MTDAIEAADQVAGLAQSRITRPRFAQVPIALLEACADRKGTLFVYGWLWHYAGLDDQAFPSITRLALECRMKPEDVRSSLRWLVENGWISRVDRPGQTALFHVRYEQTPLPKGVPLPQKGDTPKGVPHPSPKRGRGPLPQKGDPNKRDLTRGLKQDLEPPLPPSRGNASEDQGELITVEAVPVTDALSKSPESAKVQEPPPQTMALTKPRKPRFQPSQDLIPVALLPVHPEILGFWATKAGARTEQAWNGLIKQLGLIQEDPQGGTEMVRTQLQTGIDRAPIKPWLSVSYGNWRKFGMQQGTTSNRRPTPEENAAAAVAFIQARDARKAASSAASQQTLLAEVIA
ncbi:MAG: helix-turn-helix domain-containing protein [Synechococcaceae bacterium WB9_2_112]|nr:helix-turn-helix domain-containing protein [Synechococcaceae bacterium WB9_2_112]